MNKNITLTDKEIDDMIEVYDDLVPGEDVSQEDWDATNSTFPEGFDLRFVTASQKQNIANALDALFTKYNLPRVWQG